jgi:hypothetical protein
MERRPEGVSQDPGIYDRLMQLPAGKTCGDCAFLKRCLMLGCTQPESTQCDFYPNKFVEGK